MRAEPLDQYSAKAYFAKDTLNGAMTVAEQDVSTPVSEQAVDLVEKVPPSVYGYLEDVWFRDVIELEAYLNWEKAGADEKRSHELREHDYLQAYDQYKS